MANNTERRYTTEEVTAIVRRSLESRPTQDAISHSELEEIARELGVDGESLDQAIRAQETEGVREQARQEWMAKRRLQFFEHFRAYLIVNAFLLIVDLMTPAGPWFYWVLVSWGLGLAFDASDAFFPSKEKVEQGVSKVLRKRAYAKTEGWSEAPVE